MTQKTCILIGAPVQDGTAQPGCLMGPDALRTAGIGAALRDLGHGVEDWGNLSATLTDTPPHPNRAVRNLAAVAGWTRSIMEAGARAAQGGAMPIFLGGDHSISAGSVPAMAQAAQAAGREQFVLWLDAHTDFHRLDTTQSGNLHGTPVAYFTGQDGFAPYLPALPAAVAARNVCMLGIRSVDPAEKGALEDLDIHDMRAIDEHGIKRPLTVFLERVRAARGALHVSLDVDFLDPEIAPAVGTTVPGGATIREAHLVMELLCDSGLVTSLDLVELNPFLDERGRTASLMVDLCASLMGRKVLDRPTRRYG